ARRWPRCRQRPSCCCHWRNVEPRSDGTEARDRFSCEGGGRGAVSSQAPKLSMPSTRDIRRRIKSVKNTAQITKAMQMVAASKMRKAQQAALAGRSYATLMNNVLAQVTANAGDFTHPLIEIRPVKQRALVLVSSDKGLAGALNSNLMREAAKFDRANTVF